MVRRDDNDEGVAGGRRTHAHEKRACPRQPAALVFRAKRGRERPYGTCSLQSKRKPARDPAARGYSRITDSTPRSVVIGSACRCTTRQSPSSGRRMLVVLTTTSVSSEHPPSSRGTAQPQRCTPGRAWRASSGSQTR